VSGSAAERALYAFAFWTKRRDTAATDAVRAGLSPGELADAQELYLVPGVSEALWEMPESELQARMLGLAGKARTPLVRRRPMTLVEWGRSGVPSGPDAYVLEHKSVVAPSLVDLGSFTGYLAVVGVRDLQGDVLDLGSMDATVADFQAGRLQWFLTDAHSDRASDVVAEVTDAALDATGLRIKAAWLATERAQQLRALVRAGVRLGLSIDYFPVAAEPDGKGGRRLSEVVIVGGALTPKPANPLAVVVEGKAGGGTEHTRVLHASLPASAPCGDLYATMQAESERRDPARARLQRMAEVVAASWVSPALAKSIGVEAAYGLVEGAAELAAARKVEGDPMGELERERWEASNRYSSDLAAWMERNR
jgi:hypothetical protein